MNQFVKAIYHLKIHPLRRCDIEVIKGNGGVCLTGVGLWQTHRPLLMGIACHVAAHEAMTVKVFNQFNEHTHVVRKHAQ